MPVTDISVEIPALPGGWRGTPDDLFQYLAANAVFRQDGDAATGQIGGARPTQDIGIWYGDNSIEKFSGGKYRPISDVPIGMVVAWAGTGLVSPENYLFCTGQSLPRADYPELFAVIGVTYGTVTGTTFTVPDYRGRAAFGAGVGDYLPNTPSITGKMREVIAGRYGGLEWLRNSSKPAGSPSVTKVIAGTNYLTNSPGIITEIIPPFIGQQFLIRYR